ncbi:hypothetical protein WJX81_002388 [Elliptochloris bilobata]|uniref:Hflx-type G domain-containing protein n=1 Tax=Elliptochloris bilobata TaxID=381761 RepID=A0AAW1QX92_9CHLO
MLLFLFMQNVYGWALFGLIALLVVHPRDKPHTHLQEALRLAETFAGQSCAHVEVGSARSGSQTPGTFLGSGTVAELAQHCAVAEPTRVFVNATLSGVQQRNLSAAWGRPVMDRVGLIIAIFGQRARTREARLQVEMAALDYRASRLVRTLDPVTGKRGGFGEGSEVVSARERGRSGSTSGGLGGAGGGGESELQLQRRHLRDRQKTLKTQLGEVRRTREVQRAARRRAGKPQVAVVGYTNAGKSSLVAALSRRPVEARDRLFETLDPTLRKAMLPSGREVILSDTVGFISDLPHQLVTAFKATLEEVVEADLLVHVVDASSPALAQQRATVLDVLRGLGVSEATLASRMVEEGAAREHPSEWGEPQGRSRVEGDQPAPPRVFTSTVTRAGLAELLRVIDRKLGVY